MSNYAFQIKVIEEAAEVIHAMAKLQLHGPTATNPDVLDSPTNMENVILEMMQLVCSFELFISWFVSDYPKLSEEMGLDVLAVAGFDSDMMATLRAQIENKVLNKAERGN